MELNYLQEFVTLARTLHYSEAAEELFVSQATLTRHIQALEQELGEPLFSRTTRKTSLTEFGQAFLPYAESMVQLQNSSAASAAAPIRAMIFFI